MIVLDSSAAVDFLVDRGPGTWVKERLLDDPDLHSPHLLDLEVASALRGLVARQALTDQGEPLRAHISPYDASYIAPAELLEATLVTTDLRLARTRGHRARIVAP